MTEAVRRRLVTGVSANAFGSVITTAIQLVTVPVLLSLWGTALYGSWLILFSVPALLAMSDWGFENAAGNAITVAITAKDERRALEVFQAYWLIASLVSVALLAGALVILRIATPAVSSLDSRTTGLAALLLIAHVGVMLQAGLMRAVFRAIGHYAEGVMHQNIARVTDAAAVVGAALLGRGVLAAASIMLASRIVMTIVSAIFLRRHAKWVRPGLTTLGSPTVRAQLKPLLGMMAFPFGFAVSLQGMVAAVGLILGPVVVVTFATLRTLSRLVFQLGGIISNAMLPEASLAFSSGDTSLARAIHRRGCQAVLWVTVSLSAAVAVAGDWILAAWTRGAVAPDHTVLFLLLFVACIDAFWTASSVIAIGAGRFERISVIYAVSTVGSLGAALLALEFAGLTAAPAVLLAGTLVMLPIVLSTSLHLTGDSVRSFFASVVRFPSSSMFVSRRVRAGEAQA